MATVQWLAQLLYTFSVPNLLIDLLVSCSEIFYAFRGNTD